MRCLFAAKKLQSRIISAYEKRKCGATYRKEGFFMALEITEHSSLLSTAPQACAEDMAQVAQAGFKSVMNNRPNFEGGADQPTAQAVEAAARAQGLHFYHLPFSGADLSPSLALQFAQMLGDAPKPILLYCRTGTRSTMIVRMALELGFLNPDDLSFVARV